MSQIPWSVATVHNVVPPSAAKYEGNEGSLVISLTEQIPERVDVVVIGAGINGLAVARELAHRGFSVIAFDRGDIAAETSAISTRLVHGGLKYLERFELNLVLECARERNILFRTAPHLVKRYPMLIPFSKSNKRPGWMLSAGLILQDLLSLIKPVPRSELVGPREMERRWPSLSAAGIKFGAVYHDSHVPLTERFSSEMVLDSVAQGAQFFTYTEVTGVDRGPNGVVGVSWRDIRSGANGTVETSVAINAAGPWIDDVLALTTAHPRLMGPTRGSHFIVSDFPGAPDTCIFFESPLDSRPMFILPWEGLYMLGTTDIPVDAATPPIVADATEVAYTLESVNRLVPQAKLGHDDVLWSYSGVRPLPYTEGVEDPSKITRDYRLESHGGEMTGFFTIVGGKWTTHRALGEDVANQVHEFLGLPHETSPTRLARLPGAPVEGSAIDFPEWLGERSRVRLVHVYGELARQILVAAQEDPALRELLDSSTGAIAAEVWWALHREGAKTLGDIVLRRMATFINRRAGLDSARVIADLLVRWGHWSTEHAQNELVSYTEWIRRYTPRELERTW